MLAGSREPLSRPRCAAKRLITTSPQRRPRPPRQHARRQRPNDGTARARSTRNKSTPRRSTPNESTVRRPIRSRSTVRRSTMKRVSLGGRTLKRSTLDGMTVKRATLNGRPLKRSTLNRTTRLVAHNGRVTLWIHCRPSYAIESLLGTVGAALSSAPEATNVVRHDGWKWTTSSHAAREGKQPQRISELCAAHTTNSRLTKPTAGSSWNNTAATPSGGKNEATKAPTSRSTESEAGESIGVAPRSRARYRVRSIAFRHRTWGIELGRRARASSSGVGLGCRARARARVPRSGAHSGVGLGCRARARAQAPCSGAVLGRARVCCPGVPLGPSASAVAGYSHSIVAGGLLVTSMATAPTAS